MENVLVLLTSELRHKSIDKLITTIKEGFKKNAAFDDRIKAFDCLSNNILLLKFQHYGFSHKSILLSERKQNYMIQGLVLRPILTIIYSTKLTALVMISHFIFRYNNIIYIKTLQ